MAAGNRNITNIGNRYEHSPVTHIINPLNEPTIMHDLDFELPNLSKYPVIGRDKDMKEIKKFLKEKKTVAICALGGTGKTTLAIHCARTWRKEAKENNESYSLFRNVAYFMVESRKSFEESVKNLAEKLKINKEQSIFEIIKDIIKLYETEGLLVILDNLIHLNDVQELLNLENIGDKPIFMLATSQNQELHEHFHCYSLDSLLKDKAIDLMLIIFKYDIKVEENGNQIALLLKLGELHRLVGGLPLTLTHAAAWIEHSVHRKVSTGRLLKNITSYLRFVDEYMKKFQELLKEDFPEQYRTITSKSTFLALKINIDKCVKKKSRKLLYLISFLPADFIRREILEFVFDDTDLEEAMEELWKYSLISISQLCSSNRYIKIHRTVQEVSKTYLQTENIAPSHWIIAVTISCAYHSLDSVDSLEKAGYKLDNIENWPVAHQFLIMLNNFPGTEVIVTHFLPRMLEDSDLSSSSLNDDITLQHIAAVKKYKVSKNLFAFLQENGFDINAYTTQNKLTPLHIVVKCHYPKVKQKLASDKYETSIFMFKIDEMTDCGANLHMRDRNNQSPLGIIERYDSDLAKYISFNLFIVILYSYIFNLFLSITSRV